MTDYHFKKFLDQVTPLENFDDEIPPEAPNYADLVYWAATPDQEAQQFFIPDDSFKVNKKGNPVDVFYIHPTGFYEKKWNSNMDRKRSAFERTEIMLGNQASVFNESCNIYAPEYRQATYFSFFDKNKNGIKALDLAYSDIENAFDYFIEHFNDDKPFIIAGHSQGALHTHRLIKQRIENSSLQKRFICAYAIGYMIPEKSFNDLFPTIKKSESNIDNNCLVIQAKHDDRLGLGHYQKLIDSQGKYDGNLFEHHLIEDLTHAGARNNSKRDEIIRNWYEKTSNHSDSVKSA